MRFAFHHNTDPNMSEHRRHAARRLARALLFLFPLTVSVGSLVVFSILLRAEGPLIQVYAWNALTAAAILLASRKKDTAGQEVNSRSARLPVTLGTVFRAAALLLAGAGTLLVLVQLQIARRSLAEAWLDMARKGHAFGFFSFFVSELYALFLIGPLLLFGQKKYAASACAFAAIQFLCAGIILDRALFLILAFVSVLLLYAFLAGKNPVARLKSACVPVAAALIVSLVIRVLPRDPRAERFFLSPPDIAPLINRIAPSFPLLRDIPGYGFTPGAATMPSTVYFTGRPLFSVYGAPRSVHYLAETRYTDWNGSGWTEDADKGPELSLVRENPGEAGPARIGLASAGHQSGAGQQADTVDPSASVTLVLTEDFTTTIPVSVDTVAVRLSRDAPEQAEGTAFGGVRFQSGARRGIKATLYTAHETERAPEPEGYAGQWTTLTPRLAELARTLRLRARTDREFVSLILDYFGEGYTYSLETEKVPSGKDAIDFFVFEGKKGFCLYFAGAFVLLAREGGLQVRLAEGYRVQLDDRGLGSISGNNAHAWPEVYLDGEWRMFEPTPPYARENPFDYIDAHDRNARKQMEALFGTAPERTVASEGRKSTRLQPGLAGLLPGILMAAAGLGAAIFRLAEPPSRKTIRRARKMTAKFRKQGIAGPEISGWKKWGESVEAKAPDAKGPELAGKMITLAFAPQDRSG